MNWQGQGGQGPGPGGGPGGPGGGPPGWPGAPMAQQPQVPQEWLGAAAAVPPGGGGGGEQAAGMAGYDPGMAMQPGASMGMPPWAQPGAMGMPPGPGMPGMGMPPQQQQYQQQYPPQQQGGGAAANDAQGLVDAFGTDARGKLVRFPDNYQPVRIGIVSLKPSTNAGTPDLEMIVSVLDGPFKGLELMRSDSHMYFNLPNVAGERPQDQAKAAQFAKRRLASWNQWCVALSGQGGNKGATCDAAALSMFGFRVGGGGTAVEQQAAQIASQFAALDPASKCEFVRVYLRMEQWNDKQVIGYIKLKDENVQQKGADGQYHDVIAVDPTTGQQAVQKRQKNELANVWPWNDERYGYALWQRGVLPGLMQQHAAMVAAGVI